VEIKSPFHPSNYKSPWPLVPFSYAPGMLHTRIPLHHLPKKLFVHDPFNLLAVDSKNRYGKAEDARKITNIWRSPDRIHEYKLKLSTAGKARLSDELLEATSQRLAPPSERVNSPESHEKDCGEKFHGYAFHSYSDTPLGPICPPIVVVHDPPPLPPTNNIADASAGLGERWEPKAIDEAHLYISPVFPVGKSHHSVLYWGEWELPRDIFLPPLSSSPVLCKKCVKADLNRILLEEDGENGERRKKKWTQKSAVLRKVVEVMKPLIGGSLPCSIGIGDDRVHKVGEKVYVVAPGKVTRRIEIEGPIRPIRTTVGWQDRSKPTCKHLLSRQPVPLTAKAGVVAKLSQCGDDHLRREARNYQDFDRHMFEHHILPPTRDLVSLGALVPQFYGYYVPEFKDDEEVEDLDDDSDSDDYMKEKDEGREGDGAIENLAKSDNSGDIQEAQARPKIKRGYLSPILLLEDCGQAISPRNLSSDEK
jgi:hypothetical protein